MTEREEAVYCYYRRKDMWRTPPTREADILSEAVTMAEMLRAVVVRVEATKKGISDLLICYRGQFIACELKDNTGSSSKHQDQFIAAVQVAGGKGAVCSTLEQVFCLITGTIFGTIHSSVAK